LEDALYETIRLLIADRLDVDADRVVPEARFREDLGADSLDAVDLALALEDVFGFHVPEQAFKLLPTVGDAFAYIEQRRLETAAGHEPSIVSGNEGGGSGGGASPAGEAT
jgi:acyl carrier protein